MLRASRESSDSRFLKIAGSLLTVFSVGGLLTGCVDPRSTFGPGSAGQESASKEVASPAPSSTGDTTSATPPAEGIERHQMPDRGEVVWSISATDVEVIRWSASEVDTSVQCENGAYYDNLISVEFEVEVYEEYTEAILDFSFSESDFYVVDEENALAREYGDDPVTTECLASSEQLPRNIPAGTKASGTMVFQVSVPTGRLIYQGADDALYEWTF